MVEVTSDAQYGYVYGQILNEQLTVFPNASLSTASLSTDEQESPVLPFMLQNGWFFIIGPGGYQTVIVFSELGFKPISIPMIAGNFNHVDIIINTSTGVVFPKENK